MLVKELFGTIWEQINLYINKTFDNQRINYLVINLDKMIIRDSTYLDVNKHIEHQKQKYIRLQRL